MIFNECRASVFKFVRRFSDIEKRLLFRPNNTANPIKQSLEGNLCVLLLRQKLIKYSNPTISLQKKSGYDDIIVSWKCIAVVTYAGYC
jgi:hypothetical protein